MNINFFNFNFNVNLAKRDNLKSTRYTFILLVLLLLVTFISGCSYSKDKIVNDSVSKEYGYYKVVAVAEDLEQLKNTHIDFGNELSEKSLNKLYEPVAWTWDRGKWNYTKALGIKEYPTYLVFDNEGLVLETTNLKEVDAFLNH